MKWLKKWNYLILIAAVGMIYLAGFDGWRQVGAGPFTRAREWLRTAEGAGRDQEGGSRDGSAGDPDGEGGEEPVAGVDSQGNAAAGEDPEGPGAAGNTGGQEEAQNSGGEAPEEESGKFGDGQDPAYMTVEDDYFSDAVFIGDSRTVGMCEYGGLEDITTFYASTGLTIYKIFDAEIVEVPGQSGKITIQEALQQNQFRKIYLMIGINEMGRGTVETFLEKYREVVQQLLELQPDAILYVQGILKVTTERSEQGDYINNEGIEARNEALAQLADNVRIFYLDANPLICDETGGMEPDYTFDGVHLKAKYVEIWKDYLKSHAIDLKRERGAEAPQESAQGDPPDTTLP